MLFLFVYSSSQKNLHALIKPINSMHKTKQSNQGQADYKLVSCGLFPGGLAMDKIFLNWTLSIPPPPPLPCPPAISFFSNVLFGACAF